MIWYLVYLLLFLFFMFFGFIIFNNTMLFGFLYVDYNVRALGKPNEYPKASFGQFCKNYWIELFYVLGKYYFFPLKWLNLTIKGKNTQTAILLTHGYCRNQSDWLWFRRQLKEHGYPIYCVNLENDFASLQTIASDKFAEKIKQIKAETNCSNIILIGHSMGGLVSSYYKEFLDNDKLVKAVVTIGSPILGTRVSVFAQGENAAQMCPGSQFLAQLHVLLHNDAQKYYQVCSKFDNIIFPWQSSLIETTPKEHQLVLQFTGHLGLLHSREVTNKINSWIKALG